MRKSFMINMSVLIVKLDQFVSKDILRDTFFLLKFVRHENVRL